MTNGQAKTIDLAKIGAIISAAAVAVGIVFSIGLAFGTLQEHGSDIEETKARITAIEISNAGVAADLREIKTILKERTDR